MSRKLDIRVRVDEVEKAHAVAVSQRVDKDLSAIMRDHLIKLGRRHGIASPGKLEVSE